MNKEVKKIALLVLYIALMVLYIPFQFAIQICLAPFILTLVACKRAENQAFEDVYIKGKRKHWWITRFIGFDCLFDD